MVAYWPWAIYPIGNHAHILKAVIVALLCLQLLCRVSAILVAAMKGVSLFVPVLFCVIFYYGLPFWLKGYVRKVITLQ